MLPDRLKPYFSSVRLWYVSTFARPVNEFYEEKPVTARLFRQLISKDDVVLEVGGRVGNATRKLAQLARFVHSVEADPNNYKLLRAYMKRYHNVRTYEFAAWNENGQGEMKVANNDSFSGVSSLKGIDGYEYHKMVKINLVTLDSVNFDPAPNVLAFDCEGAETEALLGCQKTLRRVKTAIIETHKTLSGYDSKSDIRRMLEESGFSLFEDGKWVIGQRMSDLPRA